MIALFALLQLADAALTYRVLSKGGKEWNPVMRWIFDRIGVVAGLITAKLIITALVWLYVAFEVVVGLCVLYAGIVSWNSYQLYRSK